MRRTETARVLTRYSVEFANPLSVELKRNEDNRGLSGFLILDSVGF
jgi:hypothetical protein